MKLNGLYPHFEQHLFNLTIGSENEESFVTSVVEAYLVRMGQGGYFFTSHAEDTYQELCHEVLEMLRKKTYGFTSIDQFREKLRCKK